MDPIVALAQRAFGVSYLYPYQRLVIANTLEGRSENARQIVVLPTGSGKTLCFTLPALVLDGITIVVYPLLALMDDQLRRLARSGVAARVLRGGRPASERTALFDDLAAGRAHCLLASPEVLAGERVRDRLARLPVAHLVVDEAHCVSEWGLTFRPTYLSLATTIEAIDPCVVTAFTATASPAVLEAMREILFPNLRPRLVLADPDRPNISYSVIECESKEATLAELVRAGIERPAIVFCRSRKRVEAVGRELAAVTGFERCGAYHAGLTPDERARIERWFFDSSDGILAATCAYGMGVDKSNIRTVIHYEIPTTVEAFLQESGRAGRDNEAARSVVLWNATDEPRETDALRAARERVMLGYLSTDRCRREYLMEALGAESGTCFGCDRCEEHEPGPIRAAREAAATARERTLRYIRRRRRVHGLGPTVQGLPIAWPESARRELLTTLISTGAVHRYAHGPWKGRLAPGTTLRKRAPYEFDIADSERYCKLDKLD
ncbi:MAG: RecQ family ATP-dependent DNA helicase [Spirochaetales bacterium]